MEICYVNNSNHSVDRIGAALAVGLDKSSKIAFIMDNTDDEKKKALSFINFYKSFVILAKFNLIILISKSDENNLESIRKKMKSFFGICERKILLLITPSEYKASKVYQYIANKYDHEKFLNKDKITLRGKFYTISLSFEDWAQKIKSFIGDNVKALPIGQTTTYLSKIENKKEIVDFLNEKIIKKSNKYKVDEFTGNFLKKITSKNSNSYYPFETLILFWIRGLNKEEQDKLSELDAADRKIDNASNQGKIDKYKRNPQHLTNPALYFDIKKALKGSLIIPIGDVLAINKYGLSKTHEPTKGSFLPPSPHTLIQFYENPIFQGENGRVNQYCFIVSLLKKFNIIQVGSRSGALEIGAYLGIPTIYFEEIDCESGDRLQKIALNFQAKQNLPLFQSAKNLPFVRIQTTKKTGFCPTPSWHDWHMNETKKEGIILSNEEIRKVKDTVDHLLENYSHILQTFQTRIWDDRRWRHRPAH